MSNEGSAVRVLLVDGSGLLGHRLAEVLGHQHTAVVLDGDPRELDAATCATSNVDAVVCALPELRPGDPDPLPALDRASRGVYNLIKTASAAGARRFVLLSSLRPFERYPPDYAVTEYWAPRPTTEPEDLIAVVAEAVAREASHTLPLKVICLRLGTVVDSTDARDPRAVHFDDVVQAGWFVNRVAGSTLTTATGAAPLTRGAPVPRPLEPPHEAWQVDVTDYTQVLDATRGMDAVINMTVMRHDPVEAFRVNTLGAYNVIRAAVECGIRRVVQTGPQQVTNTMSGGYWADIDLPSSVPPRPGVELYFISKFLGQELMRIFAEEHDLEVPTLVFGPFTNPDDCEPDELGCYPFLVSWADAAEAVRGALRAPAFPRPFEVLHIVADLPHGKYRNERTKELLHWQPRDSLDVHWRRQS